MRARAHRFDQHPDGAATGQADGKGGLVADAKGQQARHAVCQRLQRLGHHRALDAAARDRAHDLARARDRQLAAGLARGRAPGFHHGGKGRTLAGAVPVQGGFGIRSWCAVHAGPPASIMRAMRALPVAERRIEQRRGKRPARRRTAMADEQVRAPNQRRRQGRAPCPVHACAAVAALIRIKSAQFGSAHQRA